MKIRDALLFVAFAALIVCLAVDQNRAPAQFKTGRRFVEEKTKTFVDPRRFRFKTLRKTESRLRPRSSYGTRPTYSSGSSPGFSRSAIPPIPPGKFAVEFRDGTRLVGKPVNSWKPTLKSRIGTVSIPPEEITRIETTGGEIRVYLNNGDRVSGSWVSNTMRFETPFGVLTLPVNTMVRLYTGTAPRAASRSASPSYNSQKSYRSRGFGKTGVPRRVLEKTTRRR